MSNVNSGIIIYELTNPTTIDGTEYTKIELDFNSLTGDDISIAEFELAKSGLMVAGLAEFNKTYLMYISARAAKLPVEILKRFPIKDISAITRETQTFLMS